MYGLYRGAADSVFSYGFIEKDLPTASSMFLGMDLPEDDPLALAKVLALDVKKGFKVYMSPAAHTPAWSGPFIWAMCMNEEDGLSIHLDDAEDSEKRLRVTWKRQSIQDQYDLENHLRVDYFWDLFQLRAYAMVNERIDDEIRLRKQLFFRPIEEKRPQSIDHDSRVWVLAEALRQLELDLLCIASDEFFERVLSSHLKIGVDANQGSDYLPRAAGSRTVVGQRAESQERQRTVREPAGSEQPRGRGRRSCIYRQ